MANERMAKYKAHFDSQQGPRPIFTSLNGDSSWLLSFPRPKFERKSSGKAYFHIVHDPWLNGPEIQISPWLVYLSLSSTPTMTNGIGVEKIVKEIENTAADAGIVSSRSHDLTEEDSLLDAILINFHYGDHLHVPTLLTFDPRIPVFATPGGAPFISKLNHFANVIAYPDLSPSFKGDWSAHVNTPGLPSYMAFFRIKGHHELNFLTVLLWQSAPENWEAILNSPHGLFTSTPTLQSLLAHANPQFSTLALLHGLKESWTWGWQTTFGAKTGLELFRQSGARYWVSTHNDRLGYGGLVWWLVMDVFRTVEWALGQEKATSKAGEGFKLKEVKVQEVENGDFFVLN
ncbi:hypothetical protein E8E12_004549 [Didymella heteroderae]|uniref:Uncharacterized protein n=1 Tax=Didymella heteroderae TaxID=1769908 RepID=A0A9P4WK89_9PLEO|nr:hypothetical protein E8E12_004549 [Didymella heteroderae]